MLGLEKDSTNNIAMNTLTLREKEVLRLSAMGLSNKEIAYDLDLSTPTVKVHLRNIHAKTGLQNDRECTLAYWAKESSIPESAIPERIRRRIAAALLALSLFSVAFHTVDMLRVFTTRTVIAASYARTGRTRRNDNYNLQPSLS